MILYQRRFWYLLKHIAEFLVDMNHGGYFELEPSGTPVIGTVPIGLSAFLLLYSWTKNLVSVLRRVETGQVIV